MKERNEVKMKHLPQVAISWEAAAAFSLFCFSLGAALSALVLRRKREKRNAVEVIEFRTISERKSTGKQNTEKAEATGAKTREALARNLWLKKDPEPEHPALSDSRSLPAPSFKHIQTRTFWTEEIEPHRLLFEKRDELSVIRRVLAELDERGNCSSVVSGDGKSSFEPSARRFSRVTLLDHSLRTARLIKEIHDTVYTEKLLYGKHLIAALAHDMGKMEHLRSREGRYVKDDHAAASARELNRWIMERGGEKAALDMRAVVDAVRNHHRSVNEPDGILKNLKKADMAAREEEFSGARENPRQAFVLKDPATTDPPEWLLRDIPAILNYRVGPAINEALIEKKPFAHAISSTNGMVYVDPHYLFQGVRDHMEREDIADMRFFDSSHSSELHAKLLVTNSLKSRNWVGDGVKDGYYAAFWNYEYKGEKVKKGGFWIPVFSEAFDVPLSELEKRKNSELRRITSVEPCLARKRKK